MGSYNFGERIANKKGMTKYRKIEGPITMKNKGSPITCSHLNFSSKAKEKIPKF